MPFTIDETLIWQAHLSILMQSQSSGGIVENGVRNTSPSPRLPSTFPVCNKPYVVSMDFKSYESVSSTTALVYGECLVTFAFPSTTCESLEQLTSLPILMQILRAGGGEVVSVTLFPHLPGSQGAPRISPETTGR